MTVHCYAAGQRKPLVDPVAHLAGVPAPVGTIWAYKDGQRHLVWSRAPMTMTAAASRWDTVSVSWTPPGAGADSYRLYRGTALVYSGPSLAHTDGGLDPSASYNYRIDAVRGGVVVGQARASAATPALGLSLSGSAARWDIIDLAWTAPEGIDAFKLFSTYKFVGDYNGAARSARDGGLDPSASYNYRIDAYQGGRLVGSAHVPAWVATPGLGMGPMTGRGVSTSQIDLSWHNPGGLTQVRLRDSAGGVQHLDGAAAGGSRTGLAAGTAYNFAVDGVRGGQRWDNLAGVDSISTHAPQFQTREWSSHASWSASYNGSGNRRTDTTDCYYGYYSSNHGTQRSLAGWSIPDEIRTAHSIDAVKLKWWNQHAFPNGGTRVSLVGHHWGSTPGTFGATGALTEGGQVSWSAPKGGWIGDDPDDYFNVGWLRAPYGGNNRTVAEEIRYAGLQGFGLVAAVGGQNGYGYAGNDPILYIRYTVML